MDTLRLGALLSTHPPRRRDRDFPSPIRGRVFCTPTLLSRLLSLIPVTSGGARW